MESLLHKATRQHTKTHNIRLVLRTIYDSAQISRAELARTTQLTRATISDVVADLIRQGLVEEVGYGAVAVGRTPVLLSVGANARQLIGIDIANGELRAGIVNLRGQISERVCLSLRDADGEAVVTRLYQAVDTLLRQTTSPVLGIGIGVPGLIDTTGGYVRSAVNLGWQHLPLRDLMQRRYELPVSIANDSHLAALAEYTFGGHPAEHVVVLLVGRGIGAGIVLNGQMFLGDTGGAGEIGHVVVVEQGQLCRCGNLGCLETVASSRAIVRRAQELALHETGSPLHQIVARSEELTLARIGQAVAEGDVTARQVIAEVGHYLGIAVAHVVGMLNIRRIVIAGQATLFGAALVDAIREKVATRTLKILAHETEIELARLGPDAVMLGASALLLTSELGLIRFGPGAQPVQPAALPFDQPPVAVLSATAAKGG